MFLSSSVLSIERTIRFSSSLALGRSKSKEMEGENASPPMFITQSTRVLDSPRLLDERSSSDTLGTVYTAVSCRAAFPGSPPKVMVPPACSVMP